MNKNSLLFKYNQTSNEDVVPYSVFWSPWLPQSEVMTGGSASGHLTVALHEVVNLAPFVTSFSARLMASWQLYSRRVLWVVMRCNYIEPNLMNQVNVSPARLTSLPSDLLSLGAGQTEAFTLCTIKSSKGRKNLKHAPVITANQECTDL